MAGKKTGKRLLTWVLVLVMALSLLPLNALAAGEGGSPHEDVVNGYYDNSGTWQQSASSAQPDVPGIVSVSKTAARAANTKPEDNTYEVTLRVETEGIKDTNKAATVLVIDTSASMNGCMKEEHTHNEDCYTFTGPECTPDSNPNHWVHFDIIDKYSHKTFVECNYDRKTRKFYMTDEKKRDCDKEEHSHRDGNCYTRLDAAKEAAIDFLDSYRKGAQSGSGRYVALVAFNETASKSTAWKDVSSSTDYTAAKQWINGLSADGGTNLDAGLSVARTRFSEAPVSSIAAENRNIIVLTDGEPTYCLDSNGDVYGWGSFSTFIILKNTNATAKDIRDNVCPIHTICFAADNETIYDPGFNKITLSEYLKTYIASDGKAYNASSYDELTAAFSAISDIITSHLTEAVVHDSLPTGVTAADSTLFNSNGKVAWSLFEDFEKEETAGGTTVYTKTYTVTIDPETAGKDNGKYCPLNGPTTLTVKSQRTPNGATLPFPIPAGLVTVQNTPEPEPDPTPATVTLTDAEGNSLIKKHLTVTAKEAETIQNAYFCVAVTAANDATKAVFTAEPRYATTTTVKYMTGTNDGTAVEGSFVFPEQSVLTFTEEGTYTFTVKEVFDEHIKVNHTTYDDTEYTMTVNVTKDATENKLNAAVSFTKGEEDPTGSITFYNTYKTPVYDFNLTDLGITVYKNFVSKYGRSATRSFTATATIEKQETYTAVVDPDFPNYPNVPNNRSAVTVEPTYTKVGEATGTVTLKTDTIKAFDFGKDSKFQLVPGDYRITVEETNCNDRYVNYDTNDTNDTKPHTRYFNVSENGDISPIDSITITNEYTKRHTAATPSKPTLNTGDHYAYVMGYPDGTVRPNGSITRAEVSAILFRLLSDKTRDEYFTTESSFTDVKAGAWYNNSIATLEKAGVIVDTAKGGAFRPNEAITRAELAAMLAQFSDAKPVKGVKFSDVSAEHWAYEAIAIAAKMGWIEGYPDGTFRPDATITRAEMMTLVNRALERVPSDEDHLLSKRVMLTFPDCKSGDWFYIAVQEATNSHTYERAATEKNGDEQWTALRANRDWTLLEK